MDGARKKKLEAEGYKVASAQEFLGLSNEEALLVELKLAVSKAFSELRKKHGTQKEVAKLIGSSQSRVAKMEAGDRSVSLDLLARALFALGATRADLARVIRPKPKRRATKKTATEARGKKPPLTGLTAR